MIQDIIPITEARSQLGILANQVVPGRNIILTKGGKPKVALVDVNYLKRLEESMAALYQQTYVDPKLLPYTRVFSDQEIEKWAQTDQL
jgi:prevent-host-death family protein